MEDLKQQLRKFSKDRDWEQFHSPKNLAMAISVEVSEIVEIFQWMTPEESVDVKNVPSLKHEVEEEIGDVINYVLRIADILDIDLEQAVLNKIDKNALKYPPAGSNTPRSKRDMQHE